MIRLGALACVLACASPVQAQTTYTYTGATFGSINNCTLPGTPGAGPCVTYTSAMRVQGSFTLATPLPPNFGPADISTRPDLQWSFSDGVNTISSADTAHTYTDFFMAQTDALGNPVYAGTSIVVNQWQTTPGVNHFFNWINVAWHPTQDQVNTSYECFVVTGNACTNDINGPNDSGAFSPGPGTWATVTVTAAATAAPVATPTLNPWMLAVLMCSLVVVALIAVRGRQR
jgi:hypothetical protein